MTTPKRPRLTTRPATPDFGWRDPTLPPELLARIDRLPEDRRALAREDFGEIVADYREAVAGIDRTRPAERADDAELLALAARFLADALARTHPDVEAHADYALLRAGQPTLCELARNLHTPLHEIADALDEAAIEVRAHKPGRPKEAHARRLLADLERACEAHGLPLDVAHAVALALNADRGKR
jgi:hypothetical protein